MKSQHKVSLVIPCYNETEPVLLQLLTAISALEHKTPLYHFEKILVDDGSDVFITRLLNKILSENQIGFPGSYKVIRLTRNFGKEAALRAGFENASGSAVIPIDADLQDPLELVPSMLQLWDFGTTPVVLARRNDRGFDSMAKRLSSSAFYSLMDRISESRIEKNVGDFRLLDKRVISTILSLPERNIFMKGIYSWPGYPSKTIEYARPARSYGRSRFNARKLIKLGLDGVVSFSSLPLRIWSFIGLVISLIILAYLIILIILRLRGDIHIPGYTSIIVVSLFGSCLNLLCFGIFGEYISRMFTEIKGRPHFVIDRIDEISL